MDVTEQLTGQLITQMRSPTEFIEELNFLCKRLSDCYLADALPMEMEMNRDIVEGNWKQFKGKMREEWGKLNDNHLDKIGGVRDRVAGEKQETVGTDKVEADRQFKADEQAAKDNRP
jgi:uncharacterized protein YjbJ (UPF0337 family)